MLRVETPTSQVFVSKRLEASDQNESIYLPPEYQTALRLISSVSQELKTPYSIIGSLGIAATCRIPWSPIEVSSGRERDIDVFVMSDAVGKEQFNNSILAAKTSTLPKIDSKIFFGSHISLQNGQFSIKYKNEQWELNPKVFKPTIAAVSDLFIPVLHPMTHLTMLEAYNLTFKPKIQKRVDDLKEFIFNGFPGFDRLSKKDLRPLVQFKEKMQLHFMFKKLKKRVGELKSNQTFSDLVDGFHNNFSGLWEILHELAEEG